GTRDGGAFEEPRVHVFELDDQGRARRQDFYTLDQLDEARARFAELRPDPLRIPPNAASRVGERVGEGGRGADWAVVRGLCGTVVVEDRRRLIRTIGDADMLVASGKYVASLGVRISSTLLATSGDRLSLRHLRFTTGGDWPTVDAEAETLELIEVDAE